MLLLLEACGVVLADRMGIFRVLWLLTGIDRAGVSAFIECRTRGRAGLARAKIPTFEAGLSGSRGVVRKRRGRGDASCKCECKRQTHNETTNHILSFRACPAEILGQTPLHAVTTSPLIAEHQVWVPHSERRELSQAIAGSNEMVAVGTFPLIHTRRRA